MSADEPTFDASSFSRNRDRLLEHDIARKFFAAVVQRARAAHWNERRALHRRRDAVRGLGLGEELRRKDRKLVEETFGQKKTVGNFRRTRYKGKARTQLAAYFVGAAYNLLQGRSPYDVTRVAGAAAGRLCRPVAG